MMTDQDLDLIFRDARSYRYWQEGKEVSDEQIKAIYELMKWGPTANNCQPARMVWVKTPTAKQKLAECAIASNQQKILTAPVTVIIAIDKHFYDNLPQLTYGGEEAKKELRTSPEASAIAFRNSSLQGAYLMIAARALGLDCGPMSGFDAEKLNKEFFPDGKYQVNFICALGYGDKSRLHPREYRYKFEEVNDVA